MWFKNLYLYRLQDDFSVTPEELHEKLTEKLFFECGKEQKETMGWVSPLGRDSEVLAHAANGYLLMTMAMQERMLPASVVREELDERVAHIQTQEDRKVSSREKKDMREQIEFELLPQAFKRTRKLDGWIDPNDGWLILNVSSATQAEKFTGLLRKSVGSLPTKTPETAVTPISLMTEWLREGELPEPFELGAECELRGQGDEQSVAVFKKHKLLTDEVQANLETGKLVSKLMLTWDEKISFVLTDNLQLKRIKFLDVFDDQLDEHDPQSHAEKLDIEFSLMTGEVANMLKDLMACFNPQTKEDDTGDSAASADADGQES